jgi:hypothetical protein
VINPPLRWSWISHALVVLAMLVAASTPRLASAQSSGNLRKESSYALIYVTVWDAGSKTAYGVKVQVRRAGEKKVIAEQVSNHSGEVAFRVPAGKQDYLLTALVKSSKGKTKPEVTAHVENDERVELGLHLTE